MPRYILVPENADLSKIIKVALPDAMVHKETYVTPKTAGDLQKVRKPKTSGKVLNRRVLNMVKCRGKGQKFLTFLKNNDILVNESGNVYYQNKALSKTCLEELFCDILDGTRRKPPKGFEGFYEILQQNNVDLNLLPRSRKKYFI